MSRKTGTIWLLISAVMAIIGSIIALLVWRKQSAKQPEKIQRARRVDETDQD